MGKLFSFSFVSIISLLLIFSPPKQANSLPLSTESRWIVDESGHRVKLACVNWVTHLEAGVAEGLSKQPVDEISKKVAAMGFNCVRLTWPLYLQTNDTFAAITVKQSFEKLGLKESIAGIKENNPDIVDLSLLKAYQAVVSSLGKSKVMVIADNHLTVPGWCCSNTDDNGFFGDKYFDPEEWIKGLTKMATMLSAFPNVVAMSLRNELRGPKQNVKDWYRYMPRGAEAVHAANPDILVILSGLSFDNDVSFIKNQPVNLTFTKKLVFESHWYGFSNGHEWADGNSNQVCGRILNNFMRMSGYLLEQGFPLLVSEFGVDQRGTNVNDNRYISCHLAAAAEHDWEWALWSLVGSYYLRQGVIGMNEWYGMLDWNWCGIKNSTFLRRISSVQAPFRGPGMSEVPEHKVIYHPLTGLCVHSKSPKHPLKLGPCSESESWLYTENNLRLLGTNFCVQADKVGKPARLGIICKSPNAAWEMVSDSKMHWSAKVFGGSVCLDVDSNNNVVTNACVCLSGDSKCDPASQWFKLVSSTRRWRPAKHGI